MDQPGTGSHCCCNTTTEYTAQVSPLRAAGKTAKTLPSTLLSILIAFFPKCPLCWAAYMSMFGFLGLSRLPYLSWLLPVLLAFLAFHLFVLWRKASRSGYYLPLLLSIAGALFILCGRTWLPGEKWVLVTGMTGIIAGSLFNSFPIKRFPSVSYKKS